MPLLVRVVGPRNVVAPNTLMMPLLSTPESPKVLAPRVFQTPALLKLLLPAPVIETAPVTTPPALLVKVALRCPTS